MDKEKRHAKAIIRFWHKVNVAENNECWTWRGSLNTGGYGILSVDCANMLAHRFSWELHNGKIPETDSYHGVCVLHKCDNNLCVNPHHLFLGTQADNMKDKMEKGRANLGTNNKKLSPEEAAEIKKRLAAPGRVGLRSIANDYGVSHNTIWQIAHGIVWRDI